MIGSPFQQQTDVYTDAFSQNDLQDQPLESLDITLSDAELDKMLVSSLETDREYWNKKPFSLKDTDIENTNFLLGDQLDDTEFLKNDSRFVDNRLFTSVRAILSYATAQLAKPEITPSRGDDVYLKGAQDIQSCLFEHAKDNNVDQKARSAVLNLITRKRGFLKLRFDPDAGVDGDIVTELVNPEDIIISREAAYLGNPNKIYHRIGCTIDQLVSRFPEKKDEIFTAYGIQRGVYSQVSRFVYYYECWFTYKEQDNPPKEGVAWFVPDKHIILGKMPNPNWVYYKSTKKEKQANVTSMPPKPFITFNYINTGRSYIDETCLVEQALPMQKMLNKRGRQIWENADYVNGRWVASKKSFNQEDAHKLINKGAKTVALVDSDDVSKSLVNVASAPLPSYVESTLYDARNEIDQIMGTPAIFKGSQPDRKDTLGRDLLVNQQAGALQDDLVRAISSSMTQYYKILLQMMRVYYTEDHWFQIKGTDGKYEFLFLNGDKIDTEVKIGVETDSTLPLDKQSQRSIAMQLWQAGNAIDIKSLYTMLGLPDADSLAEKYLESHINPQGYLESIKTNAIDTDAESDIQLIIAGKQPEERDDYSQGYFDYFNKYISSNRFSKLADEKPQVAIKIQSFLAAVQHIIMQSMELRDSMQPEVHPQPGMEAQGVPPELPPELAQQLSAQAQPEGQPPQSPPPQAPPMV